MGNSGGRDADFQATGGFGRDPLATGGDPAYQTGGGGR